MKQEYLEDALQEISDEHLEEAVEWKNEVEVNRENVKVKRQKLPAKTSKNTYHRRKQSGWKVAVALVTAAAVIAGVMFGTQTGGPDFVGDPSALRAFAINEAEYPEMSPYPDAAKIPGGEGSKAYSEAYRVWGQERRERSNLATVFADSLDGFWEQSMAEFLSGNGSENRVCSPVNVYMALAMCAEVTDGNSRQQILDLLGVKDVEALREQASAVWNANYIDDGASTSILAASLWLNESVEYVKSTLNNLTEHYHASSYQGEMGSEKMDLALQTWLNEQTGGILEEYVQSETLDPRTVLALATTVSYQARWFDEFNVKNTENGVFYSPTGKETCEFMYEYIIQGGGYYWGESFGAVEKALDSGHSMWFILPDEGVSVDELLESGEAFDFLLSEDWENSKSAKIHFYLPKFDVSAKIDLTDGLKELGLTDIFDQERSDFSPLTEQVEVFLGKADHAARVQVDEEGVTAAAYTLMIMYGTGMPQGEEIAFRLDRPFLFAIMGTGNVPLFVGVVNQP